MKNYRVVVLGRGPGVQYAIESLQTAGVTVPELWYQDVLSDLDKEDQNKIQKLMSQGTIREEVNNHSKLLKLVDTIRLDLLLSYFYTKILKKEIIDKIKIVNCHAALLPKYRGRHPLPWMIIRGEKEGGMTYHEMVEGMDEGPILKTSSFPISENDHYADVLKKVFDVTVKHTGEIIQDYLEGNITVYSQDESKATYAPMRKPEDGLIDWHLRAREIRRFILALDRPLPGAFSYLNDKKIIFRDVNVAEMPDQVFHGKPGEVIDCAGKKAILTKEGVLYPVEIHDESNRSMLDKLKIHQQFKG